MKRSKNSGCERKYSDTFSAEKGKQIKSKRKVKKILLVRSYLFLLNNNINNLILYTITEINHKK